MALYQERYFLVTSSQGGTLADRDSVTWSEAARQSLCLLTPDMQNRRIVNTCFREAGVTHLLGLYFAANSVQELIDQMQIFGEEVTPKIK